jgi:hypothetical protein
MCENWIVGRDVSQFSVKMRVVLKTSRGLMTDVREPDELNSVNVDDKDIMNLPISQSWKWGTDIARHQHPLDPVKPVICVVSCYHLLSAVLLLRSHLFSSFCLSSAVLVGEV